MVTVMGRPTLMYSSFVDTELSEEFLKINDNGSKETPENRAEKLQELLTLINDYPELITRTDDTYLLRFLRAKYFNSKRAFYLWKSYEEFKIKYYNTWMTIDVPILKKLTVSGAVQVLPFRDQFQRRIFWLRAGLWSPKDCSIEYLLQAGGICGDATIVEPMTQVAGIVMIFDLKDVGLTHVAALTHSFAKKMTNFLASCLPVRINALHVVNERSFFSMIFSIYKVFLTDRMREKIYFHGSNMTSLHSHITPNCLPHELGGTLGVINPREWYDVLMGSMVQTELKRLGYRMTNN